MQIRRAVATCLAAASVWIPAPAFAHHCFDDVFDANAPITITGKLVGAKWVNPHVLLHVSGAEAGQSTKDWVFWTKTPNSLLRTGITRITLQRGMDITIQGYAAKDRSCDASESTGLIAACLGDARSAVFLGGRELALASTGDGGPREFGNVQDRVECTWKAR